MESNIPILLKLAANDAGLMFESDHFRGSIQEVLATPSANWRVAHNPHPQRENMLIAAENPDALFTCKDFTKDGELQKFKIGDVLCAANYVWEVVK